MKDLCLPGESVKDFRRLRKALHAEHRPEGILEHICVKDIARQIRLKERQEAWSEAAMSDSPFVRLTQAAESDDLDDLNQRQAVEQKEAEQSRKNFATAVEKLAKGCADLANVAQKAKSKKPQRLAALERQARELHSNVKEMLSAAKELAAKGLAAIALESLEIMAKASEGSARIDGQLQKALQRLASLKEFRKMYGAPAPVALLESKAKTITLVAKDVSKAPVAKDVGAKPATKDVADKFGSDLPPVKLIKRRAKKIDNDQNEDW